MGTPPRTDGRRERGNAKREVILRHAVDLASVEGLGGISIGRLASDLEISKSGVVLHFGSKLELQLATIDAAAARFVAAVVAPAEEHPDGMARLWSLCDGWLRHIEERIFPGGCFFSTVGAEFNSQPGRIRDAVAVAHGRWLELLEERIGRAIAVGELRAEVRAESLAYELDALVRHAAFQQQLHGASDAPSLARGSVATRLAEAGTARGRRVLTEYM